jgi:hypothetical protein
LDRGDCEVGFRDDYVRLRSNQFICESREAAKVPIRESSFDDDVSVFRPPQFPQPFEERCPVRTPFIGLGSGAREENRQPPDARFLSLGSTRYQRRNKEEDGDPPDHSIT